MKSRLCMLAALLAGCNARSPFSEPQDPLHDRPDAVVWVEWPAEVAIGDSYQLRAVVNSRCIDGKLILTHDVSDTTLALDARWVDLRSLTAVCKPGVPRNVPHRIEGEPLAGPSRPLRLRARMYPSDFVMPFGRLSVVARVASDTILAAGFGTLVGRPGCFRVVPAGGTDQDMTYRLDSIPAGAVTGQALWVEGHLKRNNSSCQLGVGDTLVLHLRTGRAIYFEPD